MIRRPPRSTLDRSSAASDVYKRQVGVIDLRTLMVPTKLVWPAAGISVVLIAASAAGLGETAVVVGALLGAAVLSLSLIHI